MIIGVLGKGGVGKSTISTLFVRALAKKGEVLAVDADHNMDLTYNLGNPPMNYIGGSMSTLKDRVGLTSDQSYRLLFGQAVKEEFSFSPKDPYSEEFVVDIDENIYLMSAGPQTDDVLYDESCSHSLFTPLKAYLPLLKLKENEFVVVDEKAGADGVTTGIVSGFDVAIIVVEAAEHSVKVANQLVGYLNFFKTPFEFIVNKYRSDNPKNTFLEQLPKKPIAYMDFAYEPLDEQSISEDTLGYIFENYSKDSSRISRTQEKFDRNTEYKNKKTS